MAEITILYGGPGSGKTTELLNLMQLELQRVDKKRVAFCSFTRQASYGARDRAIKQFGGEPDDYPYFRTLHSLAYRELSLSEGSIMQKKNYGELAKSLNLDPGGNFQIHDGPVIGRPNAVKLLAMCELARNRLVDLELVWKEMRNPDLGWFVLRRYRDALKFYKRETGLLDFTDVFEIYLEEGLSLPVEVAFVDEAQDLTPLQWRIVHKAFSGVRRLYVAGDDDQAIFRWAGASVEKFQILNGEKRVLGKSHRLPKTIFDAAGRIVKRIVNRTPKNWRPVHGGGNLTWHRNIESIRDLENGSWLLLARNVYLLERYMDEARKRGLFFTGKTGPSISKKDVLSIVAYEKLRLGNRIDCDQAKLVMRALGKSIGISFDNEKMYRRQDLGLPLELPIWHRAFMKMPLRKRVYVVECLRRKEKLTKEPRIRIDTIHGAKGAEAENVVLMTDMSTRTMDGFRRRQSDEWRTLYVGMTRALNKLHMILPTTGNHYPVNPRMFLE